MKPSGNGFLRCVLAACCSVGVHSITNMYSDASKNARLRPSSTMRGSEEHMPLFIERRNEQYEPARSTCAAETIDAVGFAAFTP